ncbi:hypothetical protein BU23DRAFT_75991 [Bimuria novae-zelandiae CBS 107.79]|uniref:Uncharacterized protein n=1 Tax=Bimuria novae-zelandiae CBS 107.79 TaxID=1447943 RepID=A0A6A5VI68_9PLEO|nr:hypothetical protein BU23DRAFT_75991 [Bimuria novae-zelandiae CBS 107.79]
MDEKIEWPWFQLPELKRVALQRDTRIDFNVPTLNAHSPSSITSLKINRSFVNLFPGSTVYRQWPQHFFRFASLQHLTFGLETYKYYPHPMHRRILSVDLSVIMAIDFSARATLRTLTFFRNSTWEDHLLMTPIGRLWNSPSLTKLDLPHAALLDSHTTLHPPVNQLLPPMIQNLILRRLYGN